MQRKPVNATEGPVAAGGYAQAVLVTDARRILHVSGQIPVRPDGMVPAGFDEQARQVWRNIEAQLAAAGMGLQHLVKLTVFLSSRADRAANARIRREVLGDHEPALTVIIAGIYDEAWLLEIDAVAMD